MFCDESLVTPLRHSIRSLFLQRYMVPSIPIQIVPSHNVHIGKWKQYINEKSTSKSWYFVHKSTFGNVRWVLLHIFIPWYILVSIVDLFTLIFLPIELHYACDNFFYIFEITACVIIYARTPYYRDIFHVRKELFSQLKLGTVCNYTVVRCNPFPNLKTYIF